MEPAKAKVEYTKGFKDGYDFVVQVLDSVARKETKLDPKLRRILNDVVLVISSVLVKELPMVIKELTDDKV